MRVHRLAYTIALTLGLAASALPQDSGRVEQNPYRFEVTPAKLPDGNDVWSVQMVRSGGFTGRVMTATLTSEGKVACLACNGRNVSETLSKESLKALAPSFDPKTTLADKPKVQLVKPGDVLTLTPSALCSDCFVTRMTVQHRDATGKVQTYFSSWDDVSAAGAPAELVQLANALVSLTK